MVGVGDILWGVGKVVLWIFIVVVGGLGLFSLLPIKPKANPHVKTGFTFSIHAANALDIDWREAYKAALNDLHPQIVKIPVYWDLIEPQQNQYDWTEFDDMLAQAKAHSAQVILAVGRKLPRWPECHRPDWAKSLPRAQEQQEVLDMVHAVIDRYKTHDEIIAWQVENEPLFDFGECPAWSNDRDFLKREITLAKTLDKRPVMTSDSGELSLWLRTGTLPIDALSVSLYRVIYKLGYHHWVVNPYFYQWRRWMIRPFVKRLVIGELQAEPWGPQPVQFLEDDDIQKSFTPAELAERFDFASRTGADTVVAWGVEWWYYMKQMRGDHRYWEAAQAFFTRK